MPTKPLMSASTWLHLRLFEAYGRNDKTIRLLKLRTNNLVEQPEVTSIPGLLEEYNLRNAAEVAIRLARCHINLEVWQSELVLERSPQRIANLKRAIKRCQNYIAKHS